MSVEMSGYTYTGLMKEFEGLDLDSTTMRNEYDGKTWKMAKNLSYLAACDHAHLVILRTGKQDVHDRKRILKIDNLYSIFRTCSKSL